MLGGRSLELEVHHFFPFGPLVGVKREGVFLAVAFVRHAGRGVAPRVERPHPCVSVGGLGDRVATSSVFGTTSSELGSGWS